MVFQKFVFEEPVKTMNSLKKDEDNNTASQKANSFSKKNRHRKLLLLP